MNEAHSQLLEMLCNNTVFVISPGDLYTPKLFKIEGGEASQFISALELSGKQPLSDVHAKNVVTALLGMLLSSHLTIPELTLATARQNKQTHLC